MPVRFGWNDRNCQMMVVDIATCFARKQDIAGVGDKYLWTLAWPWELSIPMRPPHLPHRQRCHASAVRELKYNARRLQESGAAVCRTCRGRSVVVAAVLVLMVVRHHRLA